MKNTRAIFSPAHYRAVADIIRSIPEEDVRQVIANHFVQEFTRRSGSFSPSAFCGATGAKLSGSTRLRNA